MRALICIIVMSFASNALAAGERELVSRSSEPRPAWIRRAPPGDARHLYFVGFVSEISSLEEARELAVRRATAEIVNFFGQTGRSSFVSTEIETESARSYQVNLSIEFEGRKLTIKGIQLADFFYEEYASDAGRHYDFHALVRYPRREYQAVLDQAKREVERVEVRGRQRAEMSLALFRTARDHVVARRYTEGIQALKEARTIVEKLPQHVALEDSEVANTALLADRIALELKKAQRLKNAIHRTLAIKVACIVEDSPTVCDEVTTSLIDHATAVGFVATDARTSSTATFLVEANLRARYSGEVGGVFYAQANGSFKAIEVTTGKIVGGGEVPKSKGAQLDRTRAGEKALAVARKRLGILVRKVLRNLQASGSSEN